ncbi:hypothetical protein PanWU01x14_133270 [Parasponia andersonii]|uniref:Uncharacterized protein n=1 Tax=Parasponia andersonii TaxID=3476 RepID=A0A2P5CQD7_PARAD|nr:hypothetical protein PanWU01x14_133270 [Parasponia andersonii]
MGSQGGRDGLNLTCLGSCLTVESSHGVHSRRDTVCLNWQPCQISGPTNCNASHLFGYRGKIVNLDKSKAFCVLGWKSRKNPRRRFQGCQGFGNWQCPIVLGGIKGDHVATSNLGRRNFNKE